MAAEKLRLLIAEDSSIVRSLYVACLENAGFEVHQSTDGKRALAMAAVLSPAVWAVEKALNWVPESA